MNDDQTPLQNPQGQIPQDPQQDQQVENTFITETAKKVVQDEQANPGSQDPELVRWAVEKLNGGVAAPTVAPAQAAPMAPTVTPAPVPQPPQPAPNELHVPHERVVYDSSADRAAGATQDNRPMNGENNGNSN